MAKTSPTSYPLDELHAAASIMRTFNKNGSDALLFTYIKNEVIQRLDRAGITYEKNYNSIINALDKHISENSVKGVKPTFNEK